MLKIIFASLLTLASTAALGAITPLAVGTVITYDETTHVDPSHPAVTSYEITEYVKPMKDGSLAYNTKVISAVSSGWGLTQEAYFGYPQAAYDVCETEDLSAYQKSFTVVTRKKEKVTVPAGTFNTCHTHLERQGSVLDSWDTPESVAGNVKYRESFKEGEYTQLELVSVTTK